MTKTNNFITNGYTYEDILTDSCHYAISGIGSLKMGINDLIEGFQISFNTEESFDEVLKHYNKTYNDFISDVVKTFKTKMRAIRKENKLNSIMDETEIKSSQPVSSITICTPTTSGYNYENLLMDACGPAIEGFASLSTGISEVMNEHECLYGTDETFKMALKRYNKTLVEFKQDVVTRYKTEKRALRRSQKSEVTILDSLASNHTTTKEINFTNDFEREIEEEITLVFGVQMLDPKTIEHEQIIENELQKMFQPVCNNTDITAVKAIPNINKSGIPQKQSKEIAVYETVEPFAHSDVQKDSKEIVTSQEQICLEEFISSEEKQPEQLEQPKAIIPLEEKKEFVESTKVISNSDSTEISLEKLAHLISSKEIKTKADFESIIKEQWQYKSGKDSKLLFSIVKICKIKGESKTLEYNVKKMASLFKNLLLEPFKKQKEAC